MFMLSGGPRAGQLVDDLPLGYHLLGVETPGPAQLVMGDMIAAVAVWPADEDGPRPA
jgi:hypothetical protein